MVEEIEKVEEKKEVVEQKEKVEEKTQAEEVEEKTAEENIEVEEKKKEEKERIGILYINPSKNNTILTLTDVAGNTISRASGGQSTKQARLKSSPTVAMLSSKRIAEDAKEHNINSFYVRIRGETGGISTSSSAHAVIKTLARDNFKIISILDITRTARGGPKKKGGRRGRRV